MLQELINTYEELKKYVFVIDRGTKGKIIVKFKNDNFYHLVGLHKINLDMFFPNYIKSKAKKYNYMKNNIEKFNNILENQIKGKYSLELRITTFSNIIDLLKSNDNTSLYSLKVPVAGSLYNGDYGLLKSYETENCLLGLKIDSNTENINDDIVSCIPQSWMASKRINKLIEFKNPIYKSCIYPIPIELYKEN